MKITVKQLKQLIREEVQLATAKNKRRRLHENEEQMPSEQEIIKTAKGMSLKDAEAILAKAGLSKEKLERNPKVDSTTDKVADHLIKSGKVPESTGSGMDEEYDPMKLPYAINLSGQTMVYSMAALAATASIGPSLGVMSAAVSAAIAVIAASIAVDKAIEKKEMGA